MAITVNEAEIQRLVRFYRNAIRDLAKEFAAEIDFTSARSFVQMQAVLKILRELDQKTERWAQRNIARLYSVASKETDRGLRKIGLSSELVGSARSYALVNEGAIQALLVDPQVGFLTGIRNGIQQIKDRMRSIQTQAKLLVRKQRLFDQTIARVGMLEGRPIAEVRDRIVDEIVSMKNIGELYFTKRARTLPPGHIVKDVAELPFVKIPTESGIRRLRVDKYAELLARTKTGQAASLARRNKALQFGQTLMQITRNRPLDDDACALYIGKAFALTEEAKKEFRVPLVEELPNGGAPFHPNCTHSELVFPVEFKTSQELILALDPPPAWALNRPWGEVQKEFKRRGGIAGIRVLNRAAVEVGHTTGGRERRRREAGLPPELAQ